MLSHALGRQGFPGPGDASTTDHSDLRPLKRPRSDSSPVNMYRETDLPGWTAPSPSAHDEQPKHTLAQASTPSSSSRPTTKEEKGSLRKLSCKECRRRTSDLCYGIYTFVVGCAEICPEGALTSGRGSRFILANTEQLHDKISMLTERVRQLEEGLAALQVTVSTETHPLLTPQLLRLKTQDLPSSDTIVSPVSHPVASAAPLLQRDNLSKTTSPTSEAVELPQARGSSDVSDGHQREGTPPEVPPDIMQLSATFPFPWAVDMSVRKRIRDALPPRSEAEHICEEARRNALWQYNLDASETFLPNLLHYCYTTPIEDLSPRRLALLLMVLSVGSLVDLNRPLGSLHGEAYHHLARASVCEIPLFEEPDFDTVHALFFMIWYHLIFSDNKKAVGYAWNLLGFVAKLTQGLNSLTDRDASRGKVIPEEHEKRRTIFWEMMNLDYRMSLSLGRPPSIYMAHVDVKPPSYLADGMYVPKEEVIYHEWKNSFLIRCLSPILDSMITVQQPDYSHILLLDANVREFGIPALLHPSNATSRNHRFLVMQRALVSTGRDIALLQLHRRYFTDAMNGPDAFSLNHRYAPSVLATYMAAASLIAAVESLFDQEDQLSARFLCFWFNAFSGAVTLSLLISRAPSSPLVPYALQDLERVSRLFRRAGQILPFSAKTLPVLDRITERSRRLYMQWHGTNSEPAAARQPHYAPNPHARNSLPACFMEAHGALARYAQHINFSAPPPPTLPASEYPPAPHMDGSSEAWLPDIYHFNSAGISIDERYAVATAPKTPFTPSSPRVSKGESFNFDYGALSADEAETVFMAWF
ncbi:hypothetical protein FISHEDRAFT_49804 [Fistulina hepatica ATCC 64428]|uniref:Xylanolytic transcriptional activator regulatory domain-containing protein n=1 Tax=Fistulina hepatica ATCC 64428 TaxID=1128425 RepID=A0A0D7A478_9AGAR|nr:hypothetical protein FISHEDRAFT_49804 [Fistulina hepatica ATCC 64428]